MSARRAEGSSGRYVRGLGEREARWLERALGPGELAIAMLGPASVATPPGLPAPAAGSSWRFLLTTERAAMVVFPKAPELEPVVHGLPENGPMEVELRLGRRSFSAGGFRWRPRRTNEVHFLEAAPLLGLGGIERRREAARLNYLHRRGRPARVSYARALLETAPSRGPIDELALALLVAFDSAAGADERALSSAQASAGLRAALESLVAVPAGGEALASFARDWRLSSALRLELVRLLLAAADRSPGAVEAALPLHRAAREELLGRQKDAVRRSVLDLSYAGHLVRAGRHEQAADVLRSRLDELPDESLTDLLPPGELDPTSTGPLALRIGLLELLVEARGEVGVPDLEAVRGLARLQPLVRERIELLRDVAVRAAGPAAEGASRPGSEPAEPATLAARAGAVCELLAPGGLAAARAEGARGPRAAREVSPDLLQSRMRHPAARRGGAFDWLQERLGRVSAPDSGALRDYAERVSPEAHPELWAAVDDAARALGLGQVSGYVSRGERGLGLRAFEGSPPFVLIGVEHLKEGSPVYLRPCALQCAVGTELAHLRFGHTRLTSTDLWDGVVSRGSDVLQLVSAFAGPLGLLGSAVSGLGRLAAIQQVLRRAELVTRGVGKAAATVGLARRAQRLGAWLGEPSPPAPHLEIGARESEPLAACRTMQLTADRAGLVLCGQAAAAVEAVLVATSDYRGELASALDDGLVPTLGRRGPDGALCLQGLAIRVAALLSFYLSEDYEVLREAAVGELQASSPAP